MKLKTKEKDVLKGCMQYLKLNGYVFIRNNSGAVISAYKGKNRMIRYGDKGSPDLIILGRHGEFIAVECKSDTGKLSPEQEDYRKRVLNSGGIYIVARSVDDLIEREL